MRVLHIFGELRFSGAELLLASGASILQNDAEHTVLSTGAAVGEFAEELESRGYRIVHKPFAVSPGFFLGLSFFIRRGRYDVVHLHAERASFWHALAAVTAGVACVRTIHAEFPFSGFLRLRRGWQRRAMEHFGVRLVACSPRVARNERKRFGTHPDVITNWFDPNRVRFASAEARFEARRRLGFSDDQFLLISLGNYAPVKNHELIVEAVREINTGSSRVGYLHCGAGGNLLEHATGAGPAEGLLAQGAVPNVGDYLVAADAFVCMSEKEGGPIALLEAAATGLPCITTDVGLVELLSDLPNVHVVSAESADLAAAIQQIRKTDIAVRRAFGRELSREVAERFSPEAGARAYMDLYARLSSRNNATV